MLQEYLQNQLKKLILSKTVQVFALVLGNGINTLLGFLLVPYLSRALTISDYGTYGQVLMLIGFFITTLGFGLDKVLYADLANENIKSSDTIFSNALISFLFGLAGTILVLISYSWIANYLNNLILSKLLLIYGLSIPFHLLFKSFTSTLVFYGYVKKSVVINVVTNILRLVLIFVFVQIYYSLTLIFISLVFVPLIQSIWSFARIPKSIKQSGSSKKVLMINQIKNGIPLGLTVIISTVFTLTDGLMVSKLLGVENYAIFRNGATQIPIMASIYSSVNTIILPDVSKLYAKGELKKITELKSRALINTASIIYPIVLFFIVFAYILIPIYLSEKYIASYIVFMIFNCILFLRVTAYTDVYIASNKNQLLPKKFFITAIVNIILNYILITLFGVEGAALSTLISFLLLICLLIYDSMKILKTSFAELVPYKALGKVVIVSLLFSLIIRFIYYLNENLYLLPLLAAIFFISAYYLIIKYDLLEKYLIRKLLSRSILTRPLLSMFNLIYRN